PSAGPSMTHARHRPFTLEELRAYLVEVFPQIWARGHYAIEEVGPMSATVRLNYHPDHLRPGGTISGPSMFALCDLALYVAILNEIGRAKLMKLGKRLAVGEVALYSPGEADMVTHATGTYSIPARGDEPAQ